MKKILFILPGFEFGGTVFSTLNMISYLRKDYDVKVLPMVSVGPVREYYDNKILLPPVKCIEAIQIHKEDIYANKSLYLFYKVLNHLCILLHIPIMNILYRNVAHKLMSKYNFDYVASCQEGDSTIFLSYFREVKKIAWFRSEYSIYRRNHSQVYENILKEVYSRIDNIVCVSQTTRDDFARWFSNVDERAIAIHNIQNVENILLKSKEQIKDSFEKGCFNIVSVGRMNAQKRFSSIPAIAKKMKDKGLAFKWYIIGGESTDSEYIRLREEIEKMDTVDCVFPIGSRLNPYPYIASADLYVITSSYEACPRVVAEAQILHTPVVSADFSSASEFVNERTHGVVTSLENMSDVIERYIADRRFYADVKSRCNSFESDNGKIYKQLRLLFN